LALKTTDLSIVLNNSNSKLGRISKKEAGNKCKFGPYTGL